VPSIHFRLSSLKVRLASAAFGVVCSLSILSVVFACFASASGDLDPLLAKLRPAPAASAVASKALPKKSRT